MFLLTSKLFYFPSFLSLFAKVTCSRVDLPNFVLLETLCYHAQQAAEKSLKALLIYYSASVPRTHNIGTLIDLLEEYTDISESIRDVAILTEYAVSSRYPTFLEPVDLNDYELALQLADRCFLWTKSIINR